MILGELHWDQITRFLGGLRYVLLRSAIAAMVFGAAAFPFSRILLRELVAHTKVTLYYFNVSEVFFSSIEIAIYCGVFLSIPVAGFLLWQQFNFLQKTAQSQWRFVLAFVVLAYFGAIFCYLVVLPPGVGFLLSYEGEALRAIISTNSFVRFCITMVGAFACAFELPLVLVVLGKIGIVTHRMLSRTRRYAILFIVVAASIITPTPDIYNMALLAVPLYILYEVGILLLWLENRRLTRKIKSV
jgi:sec-independent protein translocase protein TatC